MSDTRPPTGTVTFLFTDVEGSTRLWEQHPEEMKDGLARHDAILRQVLTDHGGYVFSTAGDAFSASFTDPLDATNAASDAQKALVAEDWGGLGSLAARMALHTGVAHERGGDYFGPALNRCARILGAGHGGQVLVSLATSELVGERLGDGGDLKDLGEHQLKDLGEPERLFQLTDPDLADEFPPLNTLSEHLNNLPVQLTTFVGRHDELDDVIKRLADNRMLTLTGVGGSGKTRLSLQAAAESIQDYPDGVWLVELAAVTEPERLPHTLAEGLGLIRGQTGAGASLAGTGESQPILDTVLDFLEHRELLLILDNCEHLITAAAELATVVLRSCSSVTIMATSREGLGIAGETLWQVPSLSLPSAFSLDDSTHSDAIQLFAERAQAVNSAFELDESTTPAVASICRRLDGMPLAIELAAARVRALDVTQISERLDNSFRLLTGGSRTALPRQQTLLATVDWSYDLLPDRERTLFQRLAAFRGGFTLEAAEAVGPGGEVEEWEVLDLLASLVDKSMVQGGEGSGGPGRYRLLETLRQYALGKLTEIGEAEDVRARHADFFVALAEQAEPHLRGPNQVDWFDRLEDDHDNLRAAMDWSVGANRAEVAIRVAVAIWVFWSTRGYSYEGQDRIVDLTPSADRVADEVAVKLITAGANLAAFNGAFGTVETLVPIALEKAEEVRNPRLLAAAYVPMGWNAINVSDFDAARRYFSQSVALYVEARDTWGTGWARYCLGWVDRMLANVDEADRQFELATPDLREAGDALALGWVLSARAVVARYRLEYDHALDLHDEALALFEKLGDQRSVAFNTICLGIVHNLMGDPEQGLEYLLRGVDLQRDIGWTALLDESLPLTAEVAANAGRDDLALTFFNEGLDALAESGHRDRLTQALEDMVRLAPERGELLAAAKLAGKAQDLREATGRPMPPPYVPLYEQALTFIEHELGDEFGPAFAEGPPMSFGEALDLARRTAERMLTQT